jgi:DNA-binding transcriptional regulator GbsR (MarR family)
VTDRATESATDQAAEAAEHLALALTQSGMQKATARVLAAFLFIEQDTVTAPELGERLAISSGAVSAAIKMLGSAGLIERVPAPGSRREHYRLRDRAWATMMSSQNAIMQVLLDTADRGIAATGPNSLARRRLAEMRDFYAYMLRELPAVIDRWEHRRGEHR